MRKFSGALTMGLIIAATTGLVATYAFAADDTAGTNAPAQVQSAPVDNNADSANPSKANSSGSVTDKDKSPNQAAAPDANADKPNNANNTDMNKADTNQTGQAATPDTNKQSAQSQQSQQPAKKHMAMSRHHIEVIQAALANSGQTVEVDGIWGKKTTDALKDFQRAHGLKATGYLDSKTRHALPLPPKST